MPLFSYEFETEPAAQGAQGKVFFGQRADGLPVALKVAGNSRTSVEALKTEIAALGAMEQAGVAGIVPCLDAIEVEGRPAMVMPRYPRTLGRWLNRVITNPGPETLLDILDVGRRLAQTLGAMHKVDVGGHVVVHRDVKPENIFLDAEGNLFLGDFGGALTIEGLRAVELALFGTPMWAPFDQILPGRAIPDPTWDTYALCVLLYAALTGARPAYQADPRELLTERGRVLWEIARRAIEAGGDHQRTLRRDFLKARAGATAADLVELTGRSALNAADRSELERDVGRLSALARLDQKTASALQRGLWSLLNRGLSPLSHPSPPNRYRDADDLALELADLQEIASRPASPEPSQARDWILAGPMADAPDIAIDPSLEPPVRRPHLARGWAIPALAIAAVGAGLWVAWTTLAPYLPGPERVEVPGTEATGAFLLDRQEVTGERWMAEAPELPLPHPTADPALPVVGLTLVQARAFCERVKGRLPTEEEWREAAGPSVWPWGQEGPTCAHANALGCGEVLQPPGSASVGRTALGIDDLAGNAWEWVESGESGALLGGSATSPASEIGKRARSTPRPGAAPDLAGVRCAYPPER
ncbi:MAG: SUMF1/EgtB/PvdO family nonheme iron enzyme [Deltaproteobacteria bacterium]|nr:SUMF1/EgtB/PvdO family nonheme iron enzyme [Deltaproteobacteria bacterium]MBW2253722.1 SUMF1/EgtB/PvdO family nonheme iron enzyme [Deltaproteobacteria bacterium]